MSTINDLMDDEERGEQVILVHGKLMTVKDVLEEIRKKAKDKGNQRSFSEG